VVASIQEFDAKAFVKVRASLDVNEQSFLTWSGSIYALVPGEKRQHLFKMVGMSVSRCIATAEGVWDFTSRELTYYLDPNTGKILRQWHNPWTEEMLPVIHVANNPVQGVFKKSFPAVVDGDLATFVFDLFPTYPNVLAEDQQFADYSPHALYQAAELFKLTVPLADLVNPDLPSVSELHLSWDRIGPWLPWMKMGDRSGQLIYSGYGSKVKDFTELPQLLQEEINTRIPVYKNAPIAALDGEDMTSWHYFKRHFVAYLANETFPIPEAD
jgi:hypothetical protein